MTTPTKEPEQVIAGNTWQWTRSLADYAPGTWTLTYYFEKSDAAFSVACTALNGNHYANVAPATTSGVRPGIYRYVGRVTNGTDSFTPDEVQGQIEVLIDPAAAGTRDVRSDTQKYLDALMKARIRLAEGRREVTVDGYAVKFASLTEIDGAISRAREEVRSEINRDRIAKGLGSRRTIRTTL